MIKAYVYFITATFDIQNSRATPNSGAVQVTGEFITNSLAKGCFIFFQCDESTADIYRAIPRNGVEQTVSETIDVPSSTYTVYAYDIEGNDGLPNTLPANRPENETITINTNCKCVHSMYMYIHEYSVSYKER